MDDWAQLERALHFLYASLCRIFCTITRAGDLRSGHGLKTLFYFSDFNIFGDSYTLMTRGLSHNRRLNAAHTKLSFRCVSSIFLANHNTITGPLQIPDNSIMSYHQHAIPRLIKRIFADNTLNIHRF